MRFTFLTTLGAAALGLSLGARADDAQTARKMHHCNQMEINAGKLAQANGGDEVRAYGKTLTEDHMKADAELRDVATKMHVDLGSMKDMKHMRGMQGAMPQDEKLEKAARDGKLAEDQSTDRGAIVPDAKAVERNQNVGRTVPTDKSRGTQEDQGLDRSAKKTDTNDTTSADRSPAMKDDSMPRSDASTDRSVKVSDDKEMMKGHEGGEMMKGHGMMMKLEGLKGREFDRQFLTMMAKDHAKVISELREARKSMKAGDELGALIDRQLPTLQGHQEQARKLLTKIVPQARTP